MYVMQSGMPDSDGTARSDLYGTAMSLKRRIEGLEVRQMVQQGVACKGQHQLLGTAPWSCTKRYSFGVAYKVQQGV